MASFQPPSSTAAQPASADSLDDIEHLPSESGGTRSVSASSEDDEIPNVGAGREEHRDLLIASLLEYFYRAEATKAFDVGAHLREHAPEVEDKARHDFAKVAQTLASGGILSDVSTASEAKEKTRRQYLNGLINLTQAAQARPLPGDFTRDIIAKTAGLSLLRHPANDLKLTLPLRSLIPQQGELIGKGAFGRVYKVHNPLDEQVYAVKKIPLLPSVATAHREGRLRDLKDALAEVKAMAKLLHPNVVRYHTTHIDEAWGGPIEHGAQRFDPPPSQRLLLDQPSASHRERSEESEQGDLSSESESRDISQSFGIVFEDSRSHQHDQETGGPAATYGWSSASASGQISMAPSGASGEESLFTDGQSRPSHGETEPLSPHGSYLNIHMALYPSTLARYLSNAGQPQETKHCFHLVPSLRILQQILTGLRYIHRQGFVHRDIKPANIFIDQSQPHGNYDSSDGWCDVDCARCAGGSAKGKSPASSRWLKPVIGDFGLVARIQRGEVPDMASSAGTPSRPSSSSAAEQQPGASSALVVRRPKPSPVGTTLYRPPSVVEEEVDDVESHEESSNSEKGDMFALGVVLMELLCPFSTAMERADTLQQCQTGGPPEEILARRIASQDQVSDETAARVACFARSLVDPNPRTRADGKQASQQLDGILMALEA